MVFTRCRISKIENRSRSSLCHISERFSTLQKISTLPQWKWKAVVFDNL
jgi:hypothetical protein